MDWTKVKSIFEEEEKEYDWEALKTKFEPIEFDEVKFQTAYKKMATKMGLFLDPDDPKHFYDYRALYKETGKLESDETGHFPSKYKLEGHPRMEIRKEPEFKLEKAPEVKKTLWDKVKTLFEAKPIERIAKAQVSYNISQKTGIPILEVEKNLPKITKDLGLRGIPTSEEYLSAMLVFPVTAALISNPITTGIGVAKFMALTEAENYAISKLKKWEYKFGAGVGIKELLPEETSQLTKDLVDVADFMGKGLVIAKTDPKIMKMWKAFTKKISTEYTIPEKIYISGKKVRSIFQTGEKISKEETQLITDLGLSASQYKNAMKKGIDIEIPASKITTITDRPYWAKIKGLFNIKSTSQTVMTRGGKISQAKLMIEGKVKVPEVSPKVPEVKPKVKPEIPTIKTKEEIYAEKYGIPLEKVKITKVPKIEPTEEAEAISRLIEKPVEPSKEELDLIEKGFKTLSKKEFVAKLQADIKEEKLLTPEGIVKGEKGSIFIPSMAEVQNIGTKVASIVSIEAPFIKANAKETGFQIKNYYSNIGLAHQKGLKEINNLNKFNFEIPTIEESGFKASGKIDYTDITYLSERPGYFVMLTPKERARVSPAKKTIKDFYAGWEKKLKEIGWLEEPFPQSLITRNNKTIGNLKASLPRLKTPESKAKAKAEIDRLTDQNNRIKKQKIQFVSIPAKTILAKMDTDPILREKVMSILPHWGRTTITVKDLVDAKIITRKEADARAIIGEYCDRMGRKYALGKIFENAEKEGLIKSQAEKPNWATARIYIKGQHLSIPQLRGKRLDPFFSDVINDFFSRGQVTLGGLFGVTKMMQFYNPLFMPMYDVLQSAAVGTFLNPVKGAEYIARGIKDVWLKTDNWERAFENGTFSKPYVIPYDKFEYQFSEAMKGNKMGEFLKKAALPTNWIPMLYQASWNTAWTLDPMVRMMTFNYLKDKGMSDREAGQLAALFHSDYASVPPRTRKALNKALFTPTFKITMGKLYLNMLKGGAKVLTKGRGATQSEKILARGALLALAGMMGIGLYFKSQGYEEVERFRKYVKKVETDEGMKENVITLANPFNIPWRYYYRVKSAFKPWTVNNAEKLVQIAKWDLHPIWRVAIDVVDNYNWNVYNNYDDIGKIAFDVGLKTTGELVKVTQWMLESAEAGKIETDRFKALQKDLGKFEAIILKPFVFNYLRQIKEVRRTWAMKKLQSDFRYMMMVKPSKDPTVNYKRLQTFNKRMLETFKEFQ